MIHKIEINILPKFINDKIYIINKAAKKLKLTSNKISYIKIIRRSLDARKQPVYRLAIEVYIGDKPKERIEKPNYIPVRSEKKVLIIGFGPAGMFAALRLIELGIKPIIIERGKDVQTRRRDIRALQQEHIVNPDSNYCFGEGGAGAYSDGKLYTRSNKRGNVNKVLEIFVQHGASKDILIDSHPHIGSNILPKVVSNIRQIIIEINWRRN